MNPFLLREAADVLERLAGILRDGADIMEAEEPSSAPDSDPEPEDLDLDELLED